MGVHSKRGPSQASRFRKCPGTLAMVESIPKELRHGHGDAARLGTATHAVVEHCLKHDKDPSELRDRIVLVMESEDAEGTSILRQGAKLPKPKADEFVFIVGDSMIEDAEVPLEYVRGRVAELGVTMKDVEVETRTNPLPHRDDTSGTADITIKAWPELLEVDDYKNGGIGVEVIDNDQARAYLSGKAIEADWSYERYRTGIIQPNSPHADGPVRVVEYTEQELKDFLSEYEKSIQRCEEAEAAHGEIGREIEGASYTFETWAKEYLNPGSHCVFCPAGPACPARRTFAEEQARIEFGTEPRKLQLPAVVDERGVVRSSTEEEVARILNWAPYLDQLVRAAELYAHRAMEAGLDIPGYKLVPRRSVRELKEGTTIKEIVEAGYLTNSDAELAFTTPKLKSGPQLEKLVAKAKRKEFAAEFLVKPDNGTTIARIDDTRSSVEPRAILEDFGELEE